jgi:hypothetical protein
MSTPFYHTFEMPPPSVVSSADQVPIADTENDISTAPTTPDGSLTFSPTLQALRLKDALENEALGKGKATKTIESLDVVQSFGQPVVRKVCCIGAGYVGMKLHIPRERRKMLGI